MNILFCPRAQFNRKEHFWCKCQKTLGEHFPKPIILKKGQKAPGGLLTCEKFSLPAVAQHASVCVETN